jgi:hypothetical protein
VERWSGGGWSVGAREVERWSVGAREVERWSEGGDAGARHL